MGTTLYTQSLVQIVATRVIEERYVKRICFESHADVRLSEHIDPISECVGYKWLLNGVLRFDNGFYDFHFWKFIRHSA